MAIKSYGTRHRCDHAKNYSEVNGFSVLTESGRILEGEGGLIREGSLFEGGLNRSIMVTSLFDSIWVSI